LTVLGGFAFRMPSILKLDHDALDPPLGRTYVDWFSRTFSGPDANFLEAVDGALASGSTPVGFPPKLLDRTNDPHVGDYARGGIIPPTTGWHAWYPDGGDLDNEPFGRLIDM